MINAGFKKAEIASKLSDFHAQHIGAAIYYKKTLIAIGYNTEKTHTNQKHYNFYRGFDCSKNPAKLHAEMMALNKIQYLDIDFSKVHIFVFRGRHGIPQLSKPCKACEKRIRDLGIKHVHYTGNGSYVYEKYV